MLRKLLLLALVKTTTSYSQSNIEDLRKKIFANTHHKSECQTIPYKVKEGIPDVDTQLDQFIKSMTSAIQAAKPSDQLPLFHPRLKVSLEAIDNIIASEKATLGFPFEVSVYKVFALNTVDGSPGALHCNSDDISIWPQYGYPLQFGVWFQIMGQKELGRAYATIVHHENKWWIGAFHYHQWTHNSKDFEKWFQEATADAKNNLNYIAYIKLDIAAKLLDGKKEFNLPVKNQIKEFQNRILSEQSFKDQIKNILKDQKIIYTSTILAADGVGIIVRIHSDKELSGKELENTCKNMGKTLKKSKEFSKLDGLRCGFVVKNEPQDKDGFLGGLYMKLDTEKSK